MVILTLEVQVDRADEEDFLAEVRAVCDRRVALGCPTFVRTVGRVDTTVGSAPGSPQEAEMREEMFGRLRESSQLGLAGLEAPSKWSRRTGT